MNILAQKNWLLNNLPLKNKIPFKMKYNKEMMKHNE